MAAWNCVSSSEYGLVMPRSGFECMSTTGVPWALAETGYTDTAAKKSPRRIVSIYQALKKYGGIAFSYFNTNLHSQQNWKLSNSIKKNSFKRANATAARMR